MEDSTAKWSLSERLELVKELGDIKTMLGRMEERDLLVARMLDELQDDIKVTKAVAYGAKSRSDRIYWLGGGVAGLMVILELASKWFRIP